MPRSTPRLNLTSHTVTIYWTYAILRIYGISHPSEAFILLASLPPRFHTLARCLGPRNRH